MIPRTVKPIVFAVPCFSIIEIGNNIAKRIERNTVTPIQNGSIKFFKVTPLSKLLLPAQKQVQR